MTDQPASLAEHGMDGKVGGQRLRLTDFRLDGPQIVYPKTVG